MTRTLHRSVPPTLLAAALAGVLLASASARASDFTLDGCPTATPHATLTLGQQPDSATSTPSYAADNPLCPRFIVDVRAPYAKSMFEIDAAYAGPPTGPLVFPGDNPPLSQSDCGLLREYIAIYRKPWFTLSGSATFTSLGSAWYDGEWIGEDNSDPQYSVPAHCTLRLRSGSVPSSFNAAGSPLGATYRVAVSIRTTAPQKVRVHASSYQIVIPN
jgi:hypothetical protein